MRSRVRPLLAPCAALLVASSLSVPPARAESGFNMTKVSRLDSYGGYASCWGYTAPNGTELAIIGSATGTSFVDVTDPHHPEEVEFIVGAPSRWREMQTHSHYAYIVNETGGGVQIVDLSNPLHPVEVAAFDSTFQTAHTIHIRDGFAYANGTNGGMRILDLADPIHPREVAVWDGRYVHDCFVRGDLLSRRTGG